MWLATIVWVALHLAALHALQDGLLAPPDELPTRRTKWRRAVFATVAAFVAFLAFALLFAAVSAAALSAGAGLWFLLLAFPLGTAVDALVFRRVFRVGLWRAFRGSAIAVGVANLFTALLRISTLLVGGAVLAQPIAMGIAAAMVVGAFAFVRLRMRRQASRFEDAAASDAAASRLGSDRGATATDEHVDAVIELEAVRERWEDEHPGARVPFRPRAALILAGALLVVTATAALLAPLRVELSAETYATERRAEHDEVIELGPGVPPGDAWHALADDLEGRWIWRTLYLRESGEVTRATHLARLGLLAFAAFVAGLVGTVVARARLHRELTLAAVAAAAAAVAALGLREELGFSSLFGGTILAWEPHLALAFPAALLPALLLVVVPAAAWSGGGIGWTLTRWSISSRACARCGATGPWSPGGDCLACGYSGAELGDAGRVAFAAALLGGLFALLLLTPLPDLTTAARCVRGFGDGGEACTSAISQLRWDEAFNPFSTWIALFPSATLSPLVDDSIVFLHRWTLLALGALAFFGVGAGLARAAARRPLAVGAAGVIGGWLVACAFGLPMLGGLADDPTGASLPILLFFGAAWVLAGLAGALRGFRLRRAEDLVA